MRSPCSRPRSACGHRVTAAGLRVMAAVCPEPHCAGEPQQSLSPSARQAPDTDISPLCRQKNAAGVGFESSPPGAPSGDGSLSGSLPKTVRCAVPEAWTESFGQSGRAPKGSWSSALRPKPREGAGCPAHPWSVAPREGFRYPPCPGRAPPAPPACSTVLRPVNSHVRGVLRQVTTPAAPGTTRATFLGRWSRANAPPERRAR